MKSPFLSIFYQKNSVVSVATSQRQMKGLKHFHIRTPNRKKAGIPWASCTAKRHLCDKIATPEVNYNKGFQNIYSGSCHGDKGLFRTSHFFLKIRCRSDGSYLGEKTISLTTNDLMEKSGQVKHPASKSLPVFAARTSRARSTSYKYYLLCISLWWQYYWSTTDDPCGFSVKTAQPLL